MKRLPLISSLCSTPRHKLYMAIAAQMIASAGAQAAPNGGTIVGGDAIIEQFGVDTTIIQNTDRLAIDWESFNIAADERVQFIQPDSSSVALNRILGNEASQIFGRLDANGHVILMNPNGVLFGEGASINVGGLVASGLNINADDFMNGEFIFQAAEGTDGTVINKGIINAATGGNIALIGKQVDNQGLISAKLGSVNLAAGKEAVLTFDNQGLLGVRVSKEILQDELGVDAAVANSGDITAEGGRILLTGSVSQDIFSQAVNADGLNAKTSVVMHEDGSFTLGAGADVVNTGTVNTSSEKNDAGQIVVLGENVNSSGAILANSKTANAAGNIEIHSRDTTLLTNQSKTRATNNGAGSGGQIKILGDRVGVLDQSQIDTSGTNGGGDINIGGGFQGKETQLRNATRTVVGKDTLIEASAITEGDGGDVIVWADETTSFTGEINVRGGELAGDGGFVEVSGKENLRFDGRVDRGAPNGTNGTLLLDPELIFILPDLEGASLPADREVLFSDEGTAIGSNGISVFYTSDEAINEALQSGDVRLQAAGKIWFDGSGSPIRIFAPDEFSTSSLILEAGLFVGGVNTEIILGEGDLGIIVGNDQWCELCVSDDFGPMGNQINANEGIRFTNSALATNGSLNLYSNDDLLIGSTIVSTSTYLGSDLHGNRVREFNSINLGSQQRTTIELAAGLYVENDISVILGDLNSLEETFTTPDGTQYSLPNFRLPLAPTANAFFEVESPLPATEKLTFYMGGDFNVQVINPNELLAQNYPVILSRLWINTSNAQQPGIISISTNSQLSAPQIGPDFNLEESLRFPIEVNLAVTSDTSPLITQSIYSGGGNVNVNSQSNFRQNDDVFTDGGNYTAVGNELSFHPTNNVQINTDVISSADGSTTRSGNVDLISQQDIVLPTIVSGGDLNVESTQGTVSIQTSLDVAGETKITAENDISFSETSVFSPENNLLLSAGNDINFAASSDLNDPGFLELVETNSASFIFSAGRNVVIDSTLILGSGDFVASAGTKAHAPSDFPIAIAEVGLNIGSYDGPGIYANAIDTDGKIIFRSAYFIDAPILESGKDGLNGYIGYYNNGSVVLPHYANSNGNFEVYNYAGAENLLSQFQLSDGRVIDLPAIPSFEAANSGFVGWYGSGTETTLATTGGDFYVEARTIQHWGGNALDVSSAGGHGNITLVAEEEITAPRIIYSNALGQGAGESSEIRFSANKIRIDRDIDFNNAGIVDFELNANSDVVIGVVEDDVHYLEVGLFDRREGGRIFDSVGGDADQLNIQITSGGTVFQKYDLFTGGGNYSATASEFQFNDFVALNTDFANETQDALFGAGNVSIQGMSDQAELVLPGINTQTNCADPSICGTLNVSAASVANKGEIHVFGDAKLEAIGKVTISDYTLVESGQLFGLRNLFGGYLLVNSGSATISSAGSLKLGEWLVIGRVNIAAGSLGDGYSIVGNDRLEIGGEALLGGDYIEIENAETRLSGVRFIAKEVNVDYSGDLDLISLHAEGVSKLKVGGNLNLRGDGGIWGDTDTPPDALDGSPAGLLVLDIAGNVELLGERNRLSSIQILNAQNVEIFNNGELTLDGVNAESLSLNVLGDIAQSEVFTISGDTSITAATGTNIDLSNPLNDFNTLDVLATGPATINIADSGSISLANIDFNGAGQGGALSVTAANITQVENGRILLQDSAQLNLQADYITLGANGTASVDINGAVLNGVFTNDLNIQGAIRGAAGVADTRIAGLYFNGSVADNFMEIMTGASISGDFREGSKISMGDGNDIANIAGDVAVAIEGGAGEDTFIIASPNANIIQVLGGDDLDILRGPDAVNSWTFAEGDVGTLATSDATTRFSGIERIEGGNASDNFVIESTNVAIELIGGDGIDRLTGNLNDSEVNNQWNIDGTNSGSLNELVLFSSIENLIGNDGADTVTFAAGAQISDVSTGFGDDIFTLATDVTTGLLDAGDGEDTLNLNGLDSIYTYLNELIGGDGSYTTAGFEIENNEGGSKTIVGVEGYGAEWVVDGDGSVEVTARQGDVTVVNRFSGVTRLQGASGQDTFILQDGYIADGIVGSQDGTDTLVADTGVQNDWSIDGVNAGKVSAAGSEGEQLFEAITNLVGGSDNDVFNILGGADFDGTISGGGGDNSLAVLDPAATSVWTIASTNDVRIESSADVVSQITFSEIQSLIGNDNEDVLDLSAVAGSVDLERQLATASSIQSLSFQDFDAFISDAGDLVGANADSTWVLNEVSEVSYQDQNGIDHEKRFAGFKNIHGGTGEDHFRIDGYWFSEAGTIYAGTQSETLDTAELNISGTNAWSFSSSDNTAVYTDIADPEALFSATRTDALNTLEASPNGKFYLVGIEQHLGGDGNDVFFVYGDSDLYNPYIDGRGGDDYLLAHNWGAPQDLIWNITEDFGGNINDAVVFRNIENLKSHEFTVTSGDSRASYFNVADGVAIGTLIGDTSDTTFNIGTGALVGTILDNGGTDTINAAGSNNTWQLMESGGQLNSTVFTGVEILNGGNGADEFILASTTTEVIQISGGGGTNSLTAFDQANNWILNAAASTLNDNLQFEGITNLIGNAEVDTFFVNERGLSFNIDGGGGVDELRGPEQINNWLVDGTYSGTVNESVHFVSVEHLQGGSFVDQFLVTEGSSIGQIAGGGGDDFISLDTGASAIYLLGEAGSDRVVLGDLVNITGYLDGGTGDADILDISAFTGAFEFDFVTETTDNGLSYTNFDQEILPATGTSFFGGDGSTRWVFAEDNSFLIEKLDENGNVIKSGTFSSYNAVRGGAGANTFVMSTSANFNGAIRGDVAGDNSLTAADLINSWIINGQNQGRIEADNNASVTLFSNIANLIGGTGSDVFDIMAGGSITGSIYGGAGADSLIISDPTVTNNWQLGAMNSVGLVAPFEQIETVIGNANDDTFTFTGATDVVLVQGRAGGNTVLWMAGDATVNMATHQINEIVEFAEIGSFIAEQTTNNVLLGADSDNVWTLDGVASGTIANAENSIDFIGFQSLVGGAAGDDFVFTADAAGFATLNGSTGSNRIAAADQVNEWLLDSEGGDLNDTRFADMEALVGGALQDEFILVDTTSQAQVIDGGAGDNRLTGYDQANTWEVTADSAGSVTGLSSFSNIQTLVGGSAADTFSLSAGVNLSEIYGGAGNDVFVISEGVIADNFYGETGDDSFAVDVGLVLSGVLDGGTGGETDGDFIDLSQFTLLDATAELESVVGFAFRNFERIEQPNNAGVYFGGHGTNFWYITGANEGRLEIREGEKAGVYEFSGVHSVLGGEGEDVFIFANDAAAVSTLIDGGTGTGVNTLDLSAQGLVNRWLLDGANSGSVSNSSNIAGNVFTNIAYLIGGSIQDIFELHAGGSIAGGIDGGLGADELHIAVEQSSNWQLAGAAGHSATGVASFTNIEHLNGGAGVDNFDILAPLADITHLSGGGGSDAVNFLYDAPVDVDLLRGLAGGLFVEGIERFTASDTGSTLMGIDSTTTWTVDGADRGSIRYLVTDGDAIHVAFDGFGNLVGGAGDDQFLFAEGGSVSGTLNGGGGRDLVDLQQLVGDLHVATEPGIAIADGPTQLTLAAVDQLIGNGRTWLYGASDRSYTWTIDGARSGRMTSTLVDERNELLAFENLSAIRGGAHDDIFRVIAVSPLLSLDGGAAVTADLVDYSQVNGNLQINLAEALSGQNGAITGVEGIRGNNSGPDSLHNAELIGPDGGATWSIGDRDGGGLADGINDGKVAFGEQTVTFIDFNQLTGGAGADTFNQVGGIVLGTLNGGAGDDLFNIEVVGANAGTGIIGGAGIDSLILRGGEAGGLMTYTAAANGGEFDYSVADVHYKVGHQGVENLLDRTLAESLDIRGSNAAETFSLANDRFWVNGGDVIEHRNKRDIAVRSGINDIIEIADNLVVENTLTLANGTVIANDPANNSVTAAGLILDSVRDVGLASARLRTSIDDLFVRNSAGDIYLQEQNGLNLAEFNANGVFDLLLLNGDLTNGAPLLAADVFRVIANSGDITLTGANQLRDDVAVTGDRVELHNASTLTLIEVNAQDLYLRTQRGIEGDGPITVAGLTDIDAQGDVLLDFTTNDFNRVRVTNAVNLTLVDQNAIELLDINASGAVVVRSTNSITLNDTVTGGNGVEVSSGMGSINQNGNISTNSGSVVVSAGNGEVNLDEDARIVSNGGSVNINAGAGNVNMGGDTRITANGGDVNIVAADSVVVAEVVSSGQVKISAGNGSVSDGNGGATNVSAGSLQSSSNTGFGSEDALETNVGNIAITTNTGNVAVSNTGNVAVDNVSTGQGDISLVNQGNVELGGGSVVAENGANGGSVNIDVSQGSVSQSGSTDVPAVKSGGVVVISAPDGAIGEGGGLRVDAPVVEIIAAIKAGDIFVNPGADKIEYFSGSFKFDDQLLAVEPLDDINPAIFANVKSYSFNDISLLLPRDQLYDEDDEE